MRLLKFKVSCLKIYDWINIKSIHNWINFKSYVGGKKYYLQNKADYPESGYTLGWCGPREREDKKERERKMGDEL